MNDCKACQKALERPSGLYHSDCTECQARALAGSPEFATAAQAEALTVGYRDALMRVFGDHWRTAHVRVKWWADHNDATR